MFEGRVELCYRGMWGLVCDNTWDSKDAAAMCRLLGFQQDGMIISTIIFSRDSGHFEFLEGGEMTAILDHYYP